MPLAESSGLIEALTRHVLDAAVGQAAAWRAQGLDLEVAVDVSVRDLSGTLLVDSVAGALTKHGLPSCCLLLEVTEGSLFAESHRAAATLLQLDELGVVLSLDLKVDRTFVQRMASDARDAAIVRSVVDLGVGLGMRVVAEGVDDLATWRLLGDMGCDEAQGWLLSRAEPADVLTPWLLSRQASDVARVSALRR